jgi:hypothetical protein
MHLAFGTGAGAGGTARLQDGDAAVQVADGVATMTAVQPPLALRGSSPLPRGLGLGIALVALATGLLPVHTGAVQHAALGVTVVHLAEPADARPAHGPRLADGAGAVELPQCAACALRMQTLGAALPPPAPSAAPADVGLATAPPDAAGTLGAPRQAASRGPPRR